MKLAYTSIIIRDVVTMLITMIYQELVNNENALNEVVLAGGQDVNTVMFDFDVLLESIYPHKQFTEFLRCEKPEMLPYLAIIRKAKLLRSKQDDLE